MFESAELGHKVDKSDYDRQVPSLREKLLEAQYGLLEAAKTPVVILIGGVDGAGKGETVNLLNEWMDPRHIQTHAMGAPTEEEAGMPPMWRFWRELPPKGKIGIFFGSWYTSPIVERAYGRMKGGAFERALEGIVRFEQMLAAEGALLLKFWFHLSRAQQKKRLESLEADPKTRWRVTPTDWEHFRIYDKFRAVSERALRRTSTGEAPWLVVEGADARYRGLAVATSVLAGLESRLREAPAPASPPSPLPPPVDSLDVLDKLDLGATLDKESYEKKLAKYERKLNLLTRQPKFRDRSAVVVFEGADAAGKGGAIRRITGSLDARQYAVVPIAAPTDEERAQPYLWRFWRKLPRPGRLAMFDRSWYGRVLVERVEGFCAPSDWLRAYGEINDFEDQLVSHGVVVVKVWLEISEEEQLRRFEEREQTGFKRFKITPDDWRNREKRPAYHQAICDMIDRTSTASAPWTLVPANDKHHARIEVMRTLCEKLEEALD